MILCEGDLITSEHLPPDMLGRAPERQSIKVPYGLPLDLVEKEYILYSLERNGGNKARTADLLGVSEKTLYNKLNRYAAETREAQARAATTPALTSPQADASATAAGDVR